VSDRTRWQPHGPARRGRRTTPGGGAGQLCLPFNFLAGETTPAPAADAGVPAASRVFTVPASVPFLPTLIRALSAGRLVKGFTPGPLDWAGATIFLPTRRACRLARDAFLDVLRLEAAVLPRIVPLGDIDEDELVFAAMASGGAAADALTLPPVLEPLERRFLLAQLVRRWAERIAPGPSRSALVVSHPAAALALADDLARLMDDMTTREVPWSRLDGLVPDDLDRYWQLTLQFLEIARDMWPAILAERGVIEPAERRDRLIAAEAARLAQDPGRPVIAAGSTGSMPSTGRLIAAIAALDHGAVVLPGLDTDLEEEAWQAIGGPAVADEGPAVASGRPCGAGAPGHPQAAMHALLRRIGITRRDVGVLAPPQHHGRDAVMSEALRPAPATDRWRERLRAIGAAQAHALEGVTAIEAANAEEEALAIAVVLREAVTTPHRTAALVTPDRALARRVAVMLSRWDIEAEMSDGAPLAESAAGVFCRLVATAALTGLAPVPLLALLKHPLARFGLPEGRAARAAEALERAVLRGPRPAPGSRGLMSAYLGFRDDVAALRDGGEAGVHPGEPRAALEPWQLDAAHDLIARITDALSPLESFPCQTAGPAGSHDFAVLAGCHREAVRRASTDDAGTTFSGPDGEALARAFDDIAHACAQVSFAVAPGDYLEVFNAAVSDRRLRAAPAAGSRIRIYGPLEARLTGVDRVVMGGLVEGVWPPDPRTDPWLSRPMRAALGLDPPERRIGLSAHDFAQLMGAPEVVLTWPLKRSGAPAVTSRFVQRLAAVAAPLAWQQARARGERFLALSRRLDAPEAPPRPLPRPAPCPPVGARPTRLSVTEIEHWLRDPYTIYAKHILRLPRLDPVDAPPGGAERGRFIHDAIGDFARIHARALPADPTAELLRLGRARLKRHQDFPEAHALWWPRFRRIAGWFADFEVRRRSTAVITAAEIRGELTLARSARGFRLTGRADRIEHLRDGSLAVIDFKTGALPSHRQVRVGIAPQLTLEAAMLRHGAFAGLGAGGSVAELVYVRLSGGNPAGTEERVDLHDRSADDVAEAALAELERLVTRFEDETTPYRPLVLSMWSTRYGTYDDLARVKEWSLSGGETEV